MNWYSSVGLFKYTRGGNFVPKFQERTVIVEAESEEEATDLILAEFDRFGEEDVSYLDKYTVPKMFDRDEGKVIEVSSRMRTIPWNNQAYIDTYWYDPKPKSCEERGWKHEWYNKDGIHSSCYNCRTTLKGQLWKATEKEEKRQK